MSSILTDIKKLLNVPEDYAAFDTDIVIYINMAFTILNQIGIGPEEGFVIKGSEEQWEDYIGPVKNIESLKTYVFLRVKPLFDPPTNSFVLDAMKRTADELEWRLNVQVDGGEEDG